MDENSTGTITLYEDYFTLQTYNAAIETESPLDNDPDFIPFLDRAIFKLVGAMRDRDMSSEDLFNLIDVSNDKNIQLDEMIDVVKIIKDFKKKELHALHNFMDLDKNGEVDKKEWDMVTKKMEKLYDKNLAKQNKK